jgi:membrane associated rhomboid family serine protease
MRPADEEAQMFPITNTVSTRRPAIVTWALLAVNCAVFLFQQSLSPEMHEVFVARFALIPALYFSPYVEASLSLSDYLPFFTNMLLHRGWLHLILNMWTLWLFGPAVEDRLGSLRFLVFYVACGLAASYAHAVFNPLSTIPALGASGAIAGVLACFLILFPLARIIVLVPILFLPLFFELPTIVFIGLWFLVQLMQGTAELFLPTGGAGIAWWAHIGGFFAGLVLGPLLAGARRHARRYYADEGILGFTPTGRP